MTNEINRVLRTVSLVSFKVYISEKSKCSFQISSINEMLIIKAGSVLVKVNKSENELVLERLKMSKVMAIPKTASVRFSNLEPFSPR
jgi:hypothetical protein